MFTVKVTSAEIACAHRLLYYEGACHNLHGHNYVIEAELGAEDIEYTRSMVLDMKALKKALHKCIDAWDHKVLLCCEDPLIDILGSHMAYVAFDKDPTAEVLAQQVAGDLIAALKTDALGMRDASATPLYIEVRVFETSTNTASFRRSL